MNFNFRKKKNKEGRPANEVHAIKHINKLLKFTETVCINEDNCYKCTFNKAYGNLSEPLCGLYDLYIIGHMRDKQLTFTEEAIKDKYFNLLVHDKWKHDKEEE
tara:strand:+ start:1274 stop:1582 length:309 start_codon:yes stop_codon:yes gene_type:complete